MLEELEIKLKQQFGKFLLYENELAELIEPSEEEKISLAEKILAEPSRGIAGAMFENRRKQQRLKK